MQGSTVRRYLGRARLVAAESGLGVLVTGLARGAGWGYALAVLGAVVVAGALLRLRGTSADRWLLERLRRGVEEPATTPPDPFRQHDLGLAHTLLPALDVTEVTDRNLPADGPGLGVLADGFGCAAVLAFPGGTLPDLPADLVGEWLTTDPARPTAAQLVVEQFGPPPWDLLHRYPATAAYRQLPGGLRPVAVRSWLVVRHEPLDAPEAAERRGGGLPGARAATAAATARIRARLASAGAATVPLTADELRDLLRQTGDADGGGRATPTRWTGTGRTHCSVTVPVTSQAEWSGLLRGLAGCAAERVVAAATLTRDGPALRVRTVVRLVSTLAPHAAAEQQRLLRDGVLPESPTDQRAGLLATLPVAHPFRSLIETIGADAPGALR